MTILPTPPKRLSQFPFLLLGTSTLKPTWSTLLSPQRALLPPRQSLLPPRQPLLLPLWYLMSKALSPLRTSLLRRVQAVYPALQKDWTYKSAAHGEENKGENP